MEGWIKLHRKISENKLWYSEPFTRGQAWVDLLLIANHTDSFFYCRDHQINVKRGQVGWSENKLALRWQWSRNKVRGFLRTLKNEQQIDQEKSKSYSIITIINYEEYQDNGQQVEQQKNNSRTTEKHQQDTNKNDKNDKNEKNTIIMSNPTPQNSLTTLFLEKLKIKPNTRELKELISSCGTDKLESAIDRAVIYWQRENKKRKFRLAKRWNKFSENINVFLSDEDLQDRIQQEIDWDNDEIIKKANSKCFEKIPNRHDPPENMTLEEQKKYYGVK